ncbi:hypothetical protein [Rhodococcus sp. 11-3]|uniref:hypothetical protein n=1 Tax=Rhodococcus sp. 11-3 TaxID=2854796 RepID=UPI00203A672C|nr:hypothetical protein [Rhodococcus sp. 11-3]USC17013.1 hypothetical protein KZJ41_09165 [Rhodococcus sp. 11-3]
MTGRNAQGEYVFVRPKAVAGVLGSYFVNETVEIAPEAFWGKPKPTDWQQVARAAGLELLPWQAEVLRQWEARGMDMPIEPAGRGDRSTLAAVWNEVHR